MVKQAGLEVLSLNMKKGQPDIRSVLRLWLLSIVMRPDIVQCWMYHANLLGLTLMKPAKTLWNIRCSDMDLSRYGSVYRFTVTAGARFSHLPAAVIVNSYNGKDVHTGLGYHPKEWIVIPNGFNTEQYKPDPEARHSIRAELNIPAQAPAIGLVCRFDPMKDHASFITAARSFLRVNKDTHFILAGRGVSRDNSPFMELLADFPQKDHLHILGERTDAERIFASLDIASSTSAWGEGLPNVVGEAMATATPCVVTDAGDSRILVGETGITVPRKDPQALCSAWKSLLDAGADQRKFLGEQARKRIIDHYSLNTMTRSYEHLYQKLLKLAPGQSVPGQ